MPTRCYILVFGWKSYDRSRTTGVMGSIEIAPNGRSGPEHAEASRFQARGKSMRVSRLALMVILIFRLLLAPLAAETQQAARIPSVGILRHGTSDALGTSIEALRQGLRELGDVEGQTIALESRFGAQRAMQAQVIEFRSPAELEGVLRQVTRRRRAPLSRCLHRCRLAARSPSPNSAPGTVFR